MTTDQLKKFVLYLIILNIVTWGLVWLLPEYPQPTCPPYDQCTPRAYAADCRCWER